MHIANLLILVLTTGVFARQPIKITNYWNKTFEGTFKLHFCHRMHGWIARLTFDKPIDHLEIFRADIIATGSDNREFILQNKPWEGDHLTNSLLIIPFIAHIDGDTPFGGSVDLVGCQTTPSTANPQTTTPLTTTDVNTTPNGQGVTSGPDVIATENTVPTVGIPVY